MQKSTSFTDLKTLSVESLSSGMSSSTSELGLASGDSGVELNTLGRSRSKSMNSSEVCRSQSMHHGSCSTLLKTSSILTPLDRNSEDNLTSKSMLTLATFDEDKGYRNLLRRPKKDCPDFNTLSPSEKRHHIKECTTKRNIDKLSLNDKSGSKSLRRTISCMFRPRSMTSIDLHNQ